MLSERQQQQSWRNLFTGESINAGARQSLPVAEILARFPVAVLMAEES